MAGKQHNGNGHGHVTETPDVSHIKNLDVTHEKSDVSVSGLLKFVAALTVMTFLVAVLMWGLFRFFESQAEKETKPGPMAMTKEERLPPEPRLQSAPGFGVKLENGKWVTLEKREPQAEYRVLLEQWERQLNCKHDEVTSGHNTEPGHNTEQKQAGEPLQDSPCFPIDQAMRQVVERGLPTRAEGNGIVSGVDAGMPTAASSGRVASEGRKQ
jgi:hypothetical protein